MCHAFLFSYPHAMVHCTTILIDIRVTYIHLPSSFILHAYDTCAPRSIRARQQCANLVGSRAPWRVRDEISWPASLSLLIDRELLYSDCAFTASTTVYSGFSDSDRKPYRFDLGPDMHIHLGSHPSHHPSSSQPTCDLMRPY